MLSLQAPGLSRFFLSPSAPGAFYNWTDVLKYRLHLAQSPAKSQKNYKLPKIYQNDEVLKDYEEKGIVRIIKDENSVKDKKKKEKKAIFKKKIIDEEGDENEW